MAAGTAAGTQIENIATASYDSPSGRVDLTSNNVIIRVDELLDVNVQSLMPGDVSTSPSAIGQVLRFQITNNGNGPENFVLSADLALGGDDFDPLLQLIAIDSNGNGVYDAGIDTTYVAGANDPEILPDQSIVAFLVTTIPAIAVDGNRAEAMLIAAAKTGTGTPGTLFANQGSGGGDAIVGTSGATTKASAAFVISSATLSLVKSATIADPFGGTGAVPGAIITYRIVASVTGTGQIGGLTLHDTIPSGTVYRAGTLKLDDNAMSDASDSDAAAIAAGAISATLGTVNGGETHSLTFQTTIE